MLRSLAQQLPAAAAAHHCIGIGSVWGYVGAADRHTNKYAQALHGLSVPLVLRRTAPTAAAFLSPRRLRALAEEWLLQLQAEAPGAPGVAWLLSNGGAFVYAHAVALLRADAALPPARQRFPGVAFAAVVLDSAPVLVDGRSTGRALSAALGLAARPVLGAALRGAVHAAFSLHRGPIDNAAFFSALEHDVGATPCRPLPRLLLACSADDEITALAPVEALAARCSAAGRSVDLWRVPSPSPHCTHLLTHRKEYERRVAALLAAAAPPPQQPQQHATAAAPWEARTGSGARGP
jgi:hypothetical protein